jgi:molybdenum cofactor synthesis domain-containing protein
VEEFNLLQKTELRIEGIELEGANLNAVAEVVADVLGLDRDEVLVTDALNCAVTIDILRSTVDAYNLVGKQEELLARLAGLPGVGISPDTSICSEGMLGWIALDETEAREALERSRQMAAEIEARIARRAMVFSTGFEVSSGQIEDTNQPTIAGRLEAEGFSVTLGPALKDDKDFIAGQLRQAVDRGYGLIVTTGGVGAEAKDQTIEALLALDPEAATPYIARFEKGVGRHVKDGVRVGAGLVHGTLIVALPGPNDEVKRGLDVLIPGLESSVDTKVLAETIARDLRQDLRKKMKHGHH